VADAIVSAKICRKCGVVKPLADFAPDKRNKDGKGARCRRCHNAAGAEWAKKNPAKMKAMIAAWGAANRERRLAKNAAWAIANAGRKKEANAAWYRANAERLKPVMLAWVKANPEKVKAKRRTYYRKHAEVERSKYSAYRKSNPEKVRACKARWRRRQIGYNTAQWAARKARKNRATPPWSDIKTINSIYRAAREMQEKTGERYHVDHIVPLKSKLVCGLHVPANLQIIPAQKNMTKQNFYWPDMPSGENNRCQN